MAEKGIRVHTERFVWRELCFIIIGVVFVLVAFVIIVVYCFADDSPTSSPLFFYFSLRRRRVRRAFIVFDVARQFPLNRFSTRFISILEIVFYSHSTSSSHPISQPVDSVVVNSSSSSAISVMFAIMNRFGLSVSRP